MYQALYRKYRPSCFKEVIGQERATKILRSEIAAGKIAHAYLFTGPRGTGKTSCARILAKAVSCLNPKDGDACTECENCREAQESETLDIVEIDAASNNGVDSVRDLREKVLTLPAKFKYRVYIIDEVHMLSTAAFNALLKTLEEPPAHVIFILATTEVQKVPATILSRCQRFDFCRINEEDIFGAIKNVCEKENIKIDDEAAVLISRLCDGGMRDALSTLDLCASKGEDITVKTVEDSLNMAGISDIKKLASLIDIHDTGAALFEIDKLHRGAVDISRLCSELMSHYRKIMIVKTIPSPATVLGVSDSEADELSKMAKSITIETVMYAIRELSDALSRMNTVNRRSELEMAVIKICNPSLSTDIEALAARISELEKGTPRKAVIAEPKIEKIIQKTVQPKAEEISIREADEIPLPEPPEDDMSEKAIIHETEQNGDLVPLVQWPEVVEAVGPMCRIMQGILRDSNAYVKGNFLLIDTDDKQFFELVRQPDGQYRNYIRKAAEQVLGRSYKLGPYKREKKKEKDPLDDLKAKLEGFKIPTE